MKIEFQDRVWDLGPDELTNRQAKVIHDYTGLVLSKWLRSLAEEEHESFLRSWEALYWLMLQQNGETDAAIDDLDFAYMLFAEAFLKAGQAEDAAAKAAKAAKADPTPRPAASARSRAPRSPKNSGPGGGEPPDG